MAQPYSKKLVGIAGGATLADIGLETTTVDSRWGANAGVFGAFRSSDNTIVTLEANWVQKGAKNVRLHYLDIPLTFGGVARLNPGLSGRLYAGISFGIQLKCDSAVLLLDCDDSNSTEFTFPVGLMLANVNETGRVIGLDARYSIGLSDAFKNIRSKNRALQLRIIIGIPQG